MTYRYYSEPVKRPSNITLTKDQLHDLKCYYTEDYINDLSINELKEIAFEFMLNNLTDYNLLDMKNEVESVFSKRYFRELIREVSNNKSPPISDPW